MIVPSPAPLLDVLDLEPVGDDAYRPRHGGAGRGGHRLFGGQVAAQALRASAASVDDGYAVDSMRAYFLRPGRPDAPITYAVERVRDGRSVATRRVVALQGGAAILDLDAAFGRPQPGAGVTAGPPVVSPVGALDPPEAAPPLPRPPWRRDRLVDMRPASPARSGIRAVWARAPGPLPDDPAVHACVLAYLTDMGPVSVVVTALGHEHGRLVTASLDHCLWFHHPVRVDRWLLYELQPAGVARARGLARGSVWDQDGHLVATVLQEALARPRDLRRPAAR
ncbi:MAG TPA: acyl-CoA thioesterase domain-containing protein [Acidimicrobiales bacterium]|nr:acyl-CoA thioesterase domain-containing protein [Acidimicrobiales bacterium]